MQIRPIKWVAYKAGMTSAEFYTSQFYTWEYRGRGWYVSDSPVHLEAPFIPFYRHGYPKRGIDDGKRPTILSSFLENLKGTNKPATTHHEALDYGTLDPFRFEEPIDLRALQIKLPKDRRISPDKMKALLIMLSYITLPISFEIIGTQDEIIVQFVSDGVGIDTIETYIHAFFPNFSVIRTDSFLDRILRDDLSTYVVDFGLKHEFVRPLPMAKSFSMDPLIGVMAVFERLGCNEHAGIQILFQPTVNQWGESILRSVTMFDNSSFFLDVPEAPKLALEKIHSPLCAVTIRSFGQAEDLTDASQLLQKLCFAIQQASKGTWNELIPMSDQAYDFEQREGDIYCRESHRLGMLLNVDELVTLLHFPSESIQSKKLFVSSRKTKEVPLIGRNKEYLIGINTHSGIDTAVTYNVGDRLKHVHIIGATGTGKSTLMANLILQDIKKEIGVVLFDPHGDLVDDIMCRIPQHRLNDVVLVDPSDIEFPIGLNILEAHSDIEKEVLSSDLVAIFRRYATSWGDQMNAIVANAILAILESREGGSLHDLRRFLIEKDFRATFLKSVTDPAILYYWHKEYPILKTNSIGPILTRLNTFLRPRAIRNMVIQKKGLDFEQLLSSNKIILLKLSQGLIGIENSFLLGSLILSKLHQAILQRQQKLQRNPVFIYLDEFQHFITPSIKEMISGIRKYNVGLILSHQDLQQLQREDGELLNSVLGNINTRIVFRVGEPDAKKVQEGFSSFDQADLQNLGRGEAVIRIEQPQYDCSVDTIPLNEIDIAQSQAMRGMIITNSRKRYATSREAVEEVLYESFDNDTTAHTGKDNVPGKAPDVQQQPVNREVPVIHEKREDIHPEVSKPNEAPEVKSISNHRYLQTLIKRMAEARGFAATIEMALPDGSGQVDVLLARDGKRIAVEICNTTDPEWEMHNIHKCIIAGYETVISLSGDMKQLEKIKKKCITGIADFEKHPVLFLTPDALFSFMDEMIQEHIPAPEEVNMKGYRVNVTYDAITKEEMERKRVAVTNIVVNTMRKRKKKD